MVNKRKFIPEGVEDINAIDYEKKECIQKKINKVFKSYGYKQIRTPTFEYYDLFSEIESAINRDDMYKLIDSGGKILVLRPDVTIPVARMAATKYHDIDSYLKFMYFTSVFRSSDFRAGEKREFVQAGIEYIGNSNPEADAEVIVTAIKSLSNLGFDQIHIDIGQTDYFKGIMSELDITYEQKNGIRELIENKNFADLGNYLDILNIDQSYKNLLLEVPYLYGDFEEIANKAKERAINSTMKKAVDKLVEIYEIISDYGLQNYLFVDLGLINHLDYYSGMIFKGYIDNIGVPVLSGGRYNDLFEKFGKSFPATGFGMNVDEILKAANQYNLLSGCQTQKDYLILYDKDKRKWAIEKSMSLREQGYIVEINHASINDKKAVKDSRLKQYKTIITAIGDEIKEINNGTK